MVTKTSLRATIIEMEPGASLSLPMGVRAYSYIRNVASTIGITHKRKYSVHADSEASLLTITRHS